MKIRNKSELKKFFDVLVSGALFLLLNRQVATSKVVAGNFAHLPVCIAFFSQSYFLTTCTYRMYCTVAVHQGEWRRGTVLN